MAEIKAKHTHRQNEDHHVKKDAMKQLTAKHGHRTKDCHPRKNEAMRELTRKHGHKQHHCHPHKSIVMSELKDKHSPKKRKEKNEATIHPHEQLHKSQQVRHEARLTQKAGHNRTDAHNELLLKHRHKQDHAVVHPKPCFPAKKDVMAELQFKHGHKAVDSYQHPPLRDDMMLQIEQLRVSVAHVHHTRADFEHKSALFDELTTKHGNKSKECYPAKIELLGELKDFHSFIKVFAFLATSEHGIPARHSVPSFLES